MRPILVDEVLILPFHHLFFVDQTAVVHFVHNMGDFWGVVLLDGHFLQELP